MTTLYVNGRVFTGRLPLQEAFAVTDGTITHVGSTETILALGDHRTAVRDLEGAFVCPGFNDSHMHLLNYGASLEQCDLSRCTGSLSPLQEGLARFIRENPPTPGQWIRGRGFNQDYFSPATGIPTARDLDRVSSEYPICIVRCCGHCLVVNSKAMALLGLDSTLPQCEGGCYDVDENGAMTGVFRDTAMSYVYTRLPAPAREDLKRMLRRSCAELNRRGITSCHSDDLCAFENIGWEEVIAAYRELEEAGELTVRVCQQCQFTDAETLRQFFDRGFRSGSGSRLFRIGPLKILGDGSLGARTAYLSQGYADAPAERGIPIFTQEGFYELISLAHCYGMPSAIHAIGDGILDRILNAYEKVLEESPLPDHRCSVIHVQLTRPEQLERMARLGLHAQVQSVFLDYDSHIVRARAGDALADTSYAFRTMQEMGIHVSNGTDCPVEPPDPMRGIQCAVTRQPLDGSLPPYRPREAMTVEQILSAYTAGGAWASFEETYKGTLTPGMAADFVILSEDPFRTEPRQLSQIRVLAAFLGGVPVSGNE